MIKPRDNQARLQLKKRLRKMRGAQGVHILYFHIKTQYFSSINVFKIQRDVVALRQAGLNFILHVLKTTKYAFN